MPSEQGLGLHEGPASTPAIKQPTQSGEQGSIVRLEGRSDRLATKYGNLVSEHDDFNGQLLAVAVTKGAPTGGIRRMRGRETTGPWPSFVVSG